MNKLRKFKMGWMAIFAILLVGVLLWLFSKPTDFSFSDDPWRYAGQLAGILGTILISFEYILATRAKIFDKFFGGLDRAYIAHRTMGAVGFIFILYHPFFFALNSSLLADGLGLHFVLGSIFSYNLGILALYAYAALIFLTVYVRLPYEIWRKIHIFMGIPLFIASYHIVIIGSDIGRYLPLKIFIFGILLTAISSYIYKRFLYERLASKYEYAVKEIHQMNEITEILLEPKGKNLDFIPGQFVFIKFHSKKIHPELHPFSISSSPSEPTIRVSIKKLGDFTATLSELTSGDLVTLYGPHGEFGRKSLESNKPEIWIAGGIGITPFLSMLRYYGRIKSGKNISLIYCAKSANQFAYKNEIDSATQDTKGVQVTFYDTETNGHINAEKIDNLSGGLSGKKIFMCGPKPMMDSLASAFATQKIHPRNIVFEDFSFK